jgi:hypothetical protein
LDAKKTGFLECVRIVKWANTGEIISAQSSSSDDKSATSLNICIQNICGRSYSLLRDCFSRYPANRISMLSYDEFKSNILRGNMGRKQRDLEALFIALGGKRSEPNKDGYRVCTGLADLQLLFANLPEDIVSTNSENLALRAASTNETVASRSDRH